MESRFIINRSDRILSILKLVRVGLKQYKQPTKLNKSKFWIQDSLVSWVDCYRIISYFLTYSIRQEIKEL